MVAFGQDVTNTIYWASQPEAVQVLNTLPDEQKPQKAEALAKEGYRIDVPIMVWGWDAYKVMKMRKDYGYTWVPSALMPNITIAPGLTMVGMVPYDPNSPPSGSIKVSTEAKDYPTIAKPAEVKVDTTPVGQQSIGNLYLTTTGDTLPADSVVSEPRGKFVKRVKAGPFGNWAYWEKI